MLYLLGHPEVLRISGCANQEISMDERRREASGHSVEELGLGFVRLDGNVTLDIVEAWAINLDSLGGSVVVGSEGGLRPDPFGYFHSEGDLDLNATADLDSFEYRLDSVREQGDVFDSPQHHWIAAVEGRVQLLPTAEIALDCMLVSEGIYLSSELAREVSAEEVKERSVSTAADIG